MIFAYHPIPNIAIIGSTTFDKESLLKKVNDFTNTNTSFLFDDPSGEISSFLPSFLQEKGYETRILDINNPLVNFHYNPFSYLKIKPDLTSLVDVIMKEGEKEEEGEKKDPFWSICEKILLKAIIAFVIENEEEEESFARVLELLRLVVPKNGEARSALDDMFEQFKKSHLNSIAVQECQ